MIHFVFISIFVPVGEIFIYFAYAEMPQKPMLMYQAGLHVYVLACVFNIVIKPWCKQSICWLFTSVDSDEPVQPPFKLRNSKLYSISSLIVNELSSY